MRARSLSAGRIPCAPAPEGAARNNRPMMRRRLIIAAAASPLATSVAASVRARGGGPAARDGPLRVGADRALIDSGLAGSLRRGFSADTGITVKLVAGPALAILEAVQNGEIDAAIANAPAAEADLESQGLVHDRRAIAQGEFVLVGPAPRARGRPVAASQSGVDLLASIRDVAVGGSTPLVFLSAGDGSGAHVAELTLWRAARIAPAAPWYATAEPGRSFIAQVRSRSAYALVERGAWAALGGEPLNVMVHGDPALVERVHAMRSFRVAHPAGKIFIAWIAGGRGRAVVTGHRGYRAPQP